MCFFFIAKVQILLSAPRLVQGTTLKITFIFLEAFTIVKIKLEKNLNKTSPHKILVIHFS